MTRKDFRATLPDVYAWESQEPQYSRLGMPGISYFPGPIKGTPWVVDCLLYRDETGVLVGILNHYPVDMLPWERAGNVNIWVRPDRHRRGIGSALWREAKRRWPQLSLDRQRFTEQGAALARALARDEEADDAAH